jgi:hypothetical protein
MTRFWIIAALVFSSFAAADAQQRAMRGAQSDRAQDGVAYCNIGDVVFARGGAGFVCELENGPALMATDGGTRPGGISAFMSWLIDAGNRQGSARGFITVNYEAADAATQAICDASRLRGASNRSPIPCYKILAVID